MRRPDRLLYWVAFAGSVLLAAFLLASGDRLLHLSQFMEGSNIRLYLNQMRKAIVALPLFLLWMQVSKHRAIVTALGKAHQWWLSSPYATPAAIIFFLAVTLLVAIIGFHRIPSGDSVWVMFQTRIFAAGRLFAPAPEFPDFFKTPLPIHDARWFSYTSPGHSLVLLPGYLLGITWLVGPILGTLAVWLLYRFGLRILGANTARLMILLAATAPAFVFLFASYDFHVSSVFFTILTLYILADDQARPWPLLGAGVSLGMVFLARPYTAIAVGTPLIVFVALRRRAGLLPFVLGGLVTVALHLGYNRVLTGSYLTFPYGEMGRSAAIGFSPEFGDPDYGITGHSPFRAIVNFGYDVIVQSMQLHGWLFLSLLFIGVSLTTVRFKRRAWFWLSGLALIVAYLFYWHNGITPWGAKYWSESLPVFMALSALGIRAAPVVFRRWFGCRRDFAMRIVPFLVAYSVFIYMPTTIRYLANCGWGETPKVGNRIRDAGLHHALVFVYTDERSGPTDYTSAFLLNDPFLKGDVIYARDLGSAEDARLMALYPDRRAYVYDFNDETIQPIPDHPAVPSNSSPTGGPD